MALGATHHGDGHCSNKQDFEHGSTSEWRRACQRSRTAPASPEHKHRYTLVQGSSMRVADSRQPMAQTVAPLSNRVLPRLLVRRWVLPASQRLRDCVHRDGAMQDMVARIYAGSSRKKPQPRCGACTQGRLAHGRRGVHSPNGIEPERASPLLMPAPSMGCGGKPTSVEGSRACDRLARPQAEDNRERNAPYPIRNGQDHAWA